VLDWGRKERPLFLSTKVTNGAYFDQELDVCDVEMGIKTLLNSFWQGETQVIEGSQEIERIGHRVVHGGKEFEQPTLINAAVKERIRQLIPLAPLHNPANLQGIEIMEKFFPSLPQIAVFDTAFHTTMPEIVKTYPVPCYGFHGISHHREEACQGLAFLNVAIDSEKNRFCQPDADISASDSLKRILVLHTREEWMIARSCHTFSCPCSSN